MEGKKIYERNDNYLWFKPENLGIESLLLDQVMTLNSPMDMRHGNFEV